MNSKPHFLIFLFFTLCTHQVIGLTDFFKVGKSIDVNGNPIDIIVETSFTLSQYKIVHELLTGYERTGEAIFTAQPNNISPIANTNTFKVTSAGIHRISLQEISGTNSIVWVQQVYVPYPKAFDAIAPNNTTADKLKAQQQNQALAEKYLPITAYADDTAYFPQKIEEILAAIGNNQLYIRTFTGEDRATNSPTLSGDEALSSTEFIEFLTNKGHANFLVHADANYGSRFSVDCDAASSNCTPHSLRQSTGEKRPLTVYYSMAKIDNKVYISYIYLYGFDMKTGTKINPAQTAHLFDRENVTLILEQTNNQWQPTALVYGAHIPSVPSLFNSEIAAIIGFHGCLNHSFQNCMIRGQALTRIEIRKTKLNWQNIPKLGNHPILYVAQGSHALYPVYGRYATLLLEELSGNVSDQYTFYPNDFDLIELDTNQSAQRPLLFSGYLVDGFGTDGDARFPPFIRSPAFWVADAGSPFDTCQAGDCVPYFPTKPFGIQKHGEITGRITHLSGIATITYGDSEYYKTTTDENGHFSLIIPATGNINSTTKSLFISTTQGERRYVTHDPSAASFIPKNSSQSGRLNLSAESAISRDLGNIDFNQLDNDALFCSDIFLNHELF